MLAPEFFERFFLPLVTGGPLRPGRPIGKRALALGEGVEARSLDGSTMFTIHRLHVARRCLPVDTLDDPSVTTWALAAALHDLVQSTHPEFDRAFRRKTPTAILDLVDGTLDAIPSPQSVGVALERHSVFARVFEVHRTDTKVAWWTGSAEFLGTPPSPRLLLWPELRCVRVSNIPTAITSLGRFEDLALTARFETSLRGWLARTPMTDLATCGRGELPFGWTLPSLALVATTAGRLLVHRLLRKAPTGPATIDGALGAATYALARSGVKDERLAHAATFLAERLVAQHAEGGEIPMFDASPRAFAAAFGARFLSNQTAEHLDERSRRNVDLVLQRIAQSEAAREITRVLGE
jgi:hypothetical protein